MSGEIGSCPTGRHRSGRSARDRTERTVTPTADATRVNRRPRGAGASCSGQHLCGEPTDRSWLSFSPGAAVLPLQLWLAARCPPGFVISGAFVASAAVICATSLGIGHFGDAAIPVLERAKGAQAAVMTVTVYSLALAALFAARRQSERALEQSMQRLRLRSMVPRLVRSA